MSDTIHPTQALLAQAAWVRALALELVRDGGEAEDLAQEAILQALEHPPRESGAMRGFLRSVLRNAWLQRARSETRRRDREASAARAEALPATDDLVERLALHRRVVEAVQELEEPYRSAILLRFFDGLPPREIARRRALPVRTVNTHLQRGLAQLRARFDAEHENDRRCWARAFLPLLGPRPRLAASVTSPTVRWAVWAGTLAGAVVLWRILVPEPDPRHAAAARASAAGSSQARDAGALTDVPVATEAGRAPVEPEHALRLAGRVRTTGDDPVAGAEVAVLHLPSASFAVKAEAFVRASIALGTTTTDAQGGFALDLAAPPTSRPWRVVVRASGFGTEVRDDVFGDEPLDVRLAHAGRFEFTVLTEDDGLPCAGAHVALSLQGLRDRVFEGTADASGRVAIGALAPGLYTVEATPLEAERVFAIDLALREGESAAHTLRAQAGAVLDGAVRSARTGQPIPGARVRTTRERESVADETGRFRLAGLPVERMQVSVSVQAAGFAPLARTLERGGLPRDGLVLDLEAEARARGVLLGAQGSPIAGAWIVAGASEARSGPDGAFELDGLEPGSRPVLFVRAEGHATLTALFPRDVGPSELALGEIRLAPGASLTGRVRTRSGVALARVRVELEPLGEVAPYGSATSRNEDPAADPDKTVMIVSSPAASAPLSESPEGSSGIDASPFRDRSVRTDSQGRFRLLDLAPGRYRIASRAAGQISAPELVLELAAGESRSEVELVHDDGRVIAGRAVGSADEAIPGAWIILSTSEGATVAGRAGGVACLSELDGGFELTGLSDGVYDLDVSFHGSIGSGADARTYARAAVKGLRPPVRGLEVRLPRDLFVEGELRDEADQPIADVYVESHDDTGRRDSAATDRSGRFRVGAAEGTTIVLRVAGHVARGAADRARANDLPQWSGELRGVAAGSRGLVLHVTRKR